MLNKNLYQIMIINDILISPFKSVKKSKDKQEVARNSAAFFYRLQQVLKDKFGDGRMNFINLIYFRFGSKERTFKLKTTIES